MQIPFPQNRDCAAVEFDMLTGQMCGPGVRESEKLLGDLVDIFQDQDECSKLGLETVVYRVQVWEPAGCREEGLLWGVTNISPGRVGAEFFMTHGHFHTNPKRDEYYGTIKGKGALILMDREGKTWKEDMFPGSLHYIRGAYAHRVANTGEEPLVFWGCWPRDAGYDYASIRESGFGARLVLLDNNPQLIGSR